MELESPNPRCDQATLTGTQHTDQADDYIEATIVRSEGNTTNTEAIQLSSNVAYNAVAIVTSMNEAYTALQPVDEDTQDHHYSTVDEDYVDSTIDYDYVDRSTC